MAFIDTAKIVVKAGNGGDGIVSFRRERYVDKGGPDGGDGGKGGDVVFVASRNQNTLEKFRYNPRLVAGAGKAGAKSNRQGRQGDDLIVLVPLGTVVADSETGDVMFDLVTENEKVSIAKGGRGGFGNAHFTSSTRQVPRVAEKGERVEAKELNIELKMLADVGLVGLPNAGKSTLLSVISNAQPKIANYPFTTLQPNLGVAPIDDGALLVADIPGLIEGAAEGKGLGDDFLRHVERTAVLVHLIDSYSDDVARDYKNIEQELADYKINLSNKPRIVVLSKVDGLDDEIVNDQIAKIKEIATDKQILSISAKDGNGLKELLRTVRKQIEHYREQEFVEEEPEEEVVYRLDDESDWILVKEKKRYRLTGTKIEGFAKRTDFDNPEGIDRLEDIMTKLGITRELKRQGAKPGDKVYFGKGKDYALEL